MIKKGAKDLNKEDIQMVNRHMKILNMTNHQGNKDVEKGEQWRTVDGM